MSTNKVTVLIAEDSATQAMNLQHLLEGCGYRVVVCVDGLQALAQARRERPDLIISDIVMPGMDGFALCREVKDDPALADVPVLLVTSLRDPEDVLRGLDAGADSFITKPFEESFLVNRVRFVLLHRQMRTADRSEIGLEINLHGRKHFITSDRLQILNLLLSTYELAMQRNDDLRRSEERLRTANASLREANAQLEAQAAELQLTNQELEAYSYTVSHDLRAPLRHIDGYIAMLEEDAAEVLTGEMRQHFDSIRDSARHMGLLMDEILALSRLGRRQVERMPFRMQEAVERALAEARGRHAAATVEIAPLPDAGGDPLLLRQVWVNLLSNALKYSAPRGEAARVEVRGECDGDVARYVVRDNGVGFDPRYADRLFGVFQRLHSAEEFEGTGVGLAIVQRIVQRHGGRISATSAPGEGATFTFELPVIR